MIPYSSPSALTSFPITRHIPLPKTSTSPSRHYHSLLVEIIEDASVEAELTYIQNGLSLEQMSILHNSIPVTQSPNGILEHLLVNTEMGIRIGIVIPTSHVLDRG